MNVSRLATLASLMAGCQGLFAGNTGTDPSSSSADSDAHAVESDVNTIALRRLNRSEYDNTVQDLLGTLQTPSDAFPADDLVAGFDTIANALTMSSLQVELYEDAAESLAGEAAYGAPPVPETLRFEAEGTDVVPTNGKVSGEAWNMYGKGELAATFDVAIGGTYALSTRVWAEQVGDELVTMAMVVDGVFALTTEVVEITSSAAEVHSVEVFLGAGTHTFSVAFLNNYTDEAGENRNLWIDWLDVYGPTQVTVVAGENPVRDALVTCDPAEIGDATCAKDILRPFAERAYRRPLTNPELDQIGLIVDLVLGDGGTFDDALYEGLVTVLTSPSFLFRVELDEIPDDPTPHPITDYEMATRLSYFLWSTMPDAELLAAADRGELSTPEQITAQVERMIADPKAEALAENFGGQWLFFRAVPDAVKDPLTYPTFDATLAASMQEEMRRFFESFVFADRDMHELLTATTGEIDEVLAEHYGAADYVGPGWQTVDLGTLDRGGVLGQAGLLTVESYPTRTSPTMRGKFVLGQLLCDEPPPPPPGVDGLDEDITAQSVRDQLEQHRTDPVCASCHEVMDELGFGLEHFDGIGAWRDEDNGFPVDAMGVLEDGTSFYGARELSDVLVEDPRFEECIAEQLLTYGLGRVTLATDQAYLDAIQAQFAAGGYTFASLAVAVATSEPFMNRRGGDE